MSVSSAVAVQTNGAPLSFGRGGEHDPRHDDERRHPVTRMRPPPRSVRDRWLNRARSPRSDCSRPEGQVPAPGSDPLSRSRRRDGRARRGPRSARRPCRVGVARGSKCRPASDERLARRPACEAKRLQTPGRGCRPLSPRRDPRTATYERRPDMEPRSTNRETRRNGTVARPPRRPAPIHPTTGAGPTNRIRRSSPNAQDPEDCAMRSIRIPGRHASDPGSPQEHEERPRARHRPRAPETGERSAALFTPVSTAHG